jgi:hypothetical protein
MASWWKKVVEWATGKPVKRSYVKRVDRLGEWVRLDAAMTAAKRNGTWMSRWVARGSIRTRGPLKLREYYLPDVLVASKISLRRGKYKKRKVSRSEPAGSAPLVTPGTTSAGSSAMAAALEQARPTAYINTEADLAQAMIE